MSAIEGGGRARSWRSTAARIRTSSALGGPIREIPAGRPLLAPTPTGSETTGKPVASQSASSGTNADSPGSPRRVARARGPGRRPARSARGGGSRRCRGTTHPGGDAAGAVCLGRRVVAARLDAGGRDQRRSPAGRATRRRRTAGGRPTGPCEDRGVADSPTPAAAAPAPTRRGAEQLQRRLQFDRAPPSASTVSWAIRLVSATRSPLNGGSRGGHGWAGAAARHRSPSPAAARRSRRPCVPSGRRGRGWRPAG